MTACGSVSEIPILLQETKRISWAVCEHRRFVIQIRLKTKTQEISETWEDEGGGAHATGMLWAYVCIFM